MKILINGKNAIIKKGSSIEYIRENRLFSGRESYTLSIVFPLKDCAPNREIFGHICRHDVAKSRKLFDCVIIDKRVRLHGSLVITKVSEREVECQFTQGSCVRSAEASLDELYIDELDLGSQPAVRGTNYSPGSAIKGIDFGMNEVALPWVNEDYPEAVNNWIDYGDNGSKSWAWTPAFLSWQPYLVRIAERICRKAGFTPDFSAWYASGFKYLIICNTLPGTWEIREYARIMPHWSVSEFFDKLELLMGCEFDFDFDTRKVTCTFSGTVVQNVPAVKLDQVVDSYSAELSEEPDGCDYIGLKSLEYKKGSSDVYSYYSCDDFIRNCPVRILDYDNLASLIANNRFRTMPGYIRSNWGEQVRITVNDSPEAESRFEQTVNMLLHARAEDMYFIMRSIGVMAVPGQGNVQKYVLRPVNVFGRSRPEETENVEQLDFVPVAIDSTYIDDNDNRGPMMFLKPGTLENNSAECDDADSDCAGIIFPNNKTGSYETWADNALRNYSPEKSPFYDCIYIAFWNGTVYDPEGYVYPVLDSVGVTESWQTYSTPFSLRLRNNPLIPQGYMLPVDATQKTAFSWLDNTIPNPRAVFHIDGRRYLCEKITATFSEEGMSQLLKGEFYPLINED